MLSSFIWSFPVEVNPTAGLGNPNAGAWAEEVGAVTPAEVNGNTGVDDEPNVKDEEPEPEADNPNEKPIEEEVLELELDEKIDVVDAWELETNKPVVAAGTKDELLLALEEPIPEEKENPELDAKGLEHEVAGANDELPKPPEEELTKPNEGDDGNEPNWLVELCVDSKAPLPDWLEWVPNIDPLDWLPNIEPPVPLKVLAVEFWEELLANDGIELVDPPGPSRTLEVEFWEELWASDELEKTGWVVALNPKTPFPVLGNADDSATEELLPAMLENKDEGAEELLFMSELICDGESAGKEPPLLKIVTDVAASSELLLPELGNTADVPWTVEPDTSNGEALRDFASGVAKFDLSNGWETETVAVVEIPEPIWNEGAVENVATADDTDEPEPDAAATPFPKIELTWPSEGVTAAASWTGSVGGDELSEPLARLGAVAAPKANKAGADGVDTPDETVFPSDLNVSPAFCISLLTKVDPSVEAVVSLLQHNKKKLKYVNDYVLGQKNGAKRNLNKELVIS